MVIRKKHLERVLELTPNFPNPKIELEQYVTPSSIAADILWYAFMLGDIKDKVVVDLGCGTGRFSLGALTLGAKYVICVDIDYEVLNTLNSKVNELLLNEIIVKPIDILASDVREALALRSLTECTVIMNPPFGVQSKGADMDFLEAAMDICSTIYSIHKYSEGLMQVINNLCRVKGFKYHVISHIDFPIRWFLPKHRKSIYYVKAVVIRLKRSR